MTAEHDRTPTSHERLAGAPWDDSYRHGRPPWDVGHPQPAVVRLAAAGAFAGPTLDAGCGSGENALHIARGGVEVLGVDVAPTAIRQARDKAAERNLGATFEVADALQLHRLGRTFRHVLDCGLFHTFDDAERAAYAESLTAVTARGSVLHLLCVSDAAQGDRGPRRVREDEIRGAFPTGWDVVRIAPERLEATFEPDGLPAWLATIERT